MTPPRTGAERYFARRLDDPDYRRAYDEARARIDQIDAVIGSLNARREQLRLTKAELARRAGIKPESVRRLFAAENPNPTLATLIALATALDLELRPLPTGAAEATEELGVEAGTRHRGS